MSKPKLKAGITSALQQIETTNQPASPAKLAATSSQRSSEQSDGGKVLRTSVLLPAVLASRLRTHIKLTGQTAEETIMIAWLNHADSIAATRKTDPLVKLGIQPTVLRSVNNRKKLSLTLPFQAHQALDRTAKELKMKRSELVTVLLQAEELTV